MKTKTILVAAAAALSVGTTFAISDVAATNAHGRITVTAKVANTGEVTFLVGSSSADIRGQTTVEIKKDATFRD